ncbi:hypothetical protein [Paenibacillus tepidiphilus]|uniref:hypothetical protein n=1 Tax=Paenibacillus tepidiphilus TaxID=2608683 RepID=UPI0012383EC6|nr:hypothetical protein [Paenibacillus tepidiphilus]
MGKLMKYRRNSNIFTIAVSLLFCGMIFGAGLTHTLRNQSFQTATVQFPSGSLVNIKSNDFIEQIKRVIGVHGDAIYLFSEDTPMITLNADGQINDLRFSVLIPEYKNKSIRYMAYQLRSEETGELHITKLYEVPEPTKMVSIQALWDSLYYMPVEHVEKQVNSKADQYMLTLLKDNFVIHHPAIEESSEESGNIIHYNQTGLSNVHLSGAVISWNVLPMYTQAGQLSGLHGISSDSFVFYYSES